MGYESFMSYLQWITIIDISFKGARLQGREDTTLKHQTCLLSGRTRGNRKTRNKRKTWPRTAVGRESHPCPRLGSRLTDHLYRLVGYPTDVPHTDRHIQTHTTSIITIHSNKIDLEYKRSGRFLIMEKNYKVPLWPVSQKFHFWVTE